jgi:hypothetical protein
MSRVAVLFLLAVLGAILLGAVEARGRRLPPIPSTVIKNVRGGATAPAEINSAGSDIGWNDNGTEGDSSFLPVAATTATATATATATTDLGWTPPKGGGAAETANIDDGASMPNEIFNLVKSIVGAGVLGLPAGT